ncbi:hypothetical protein DYB32_007516 [Aphanomyces invadans]|uniref:Uncharacterized protein n=1 Tax=Aphanomyces invadans TaxID=157072 RepID=A0A418AQ75_9STRA|nr:hypothetical protein DYB32_007516 [Aphanomyces invadans]
MPGDNANARNAMFDDLLKLIKNSPRWAQSSLARRLGFSLSYGHHDDDDDDPEETVKDGRASHAWCSSTDETKLYLFGGSGPHWGQTNMGKLLQYSLHTHDWSIVPTTGTHPPPGYGQSMVSINHKLYLFGGTSGHVYVNDLFVFDEVQLSWVLLTTHGAKPSPRYKHQAVVVGNDMYIIGGGLYDPPKGFIDMHKFDTLTSTWSPVPCTGALPCSRIAHTVSVYNNTSASPKFILFGGRDETGMRLNELSEFDVASSTWVQLDDDSNAPDARDFHTSAVSGDSMYVFGGSNGDERNSDVFRFTKNHTPSTLTLLAIQTIQKFSRTNRTLQRQLRSVYIPTELHAAIDTLNTHVRVSTNDEWYPLPFVAATPQRTLSCRSRTSSAFSSTSCEDGI